ncbi:type II toxin-antitoxin system PemK/MazF family toxin [Streptomyces sp. NPDC048182]|uniref:type II toxin-antitoxin system PemK/MazF family toxin n=1 Tax=Streptomyces sp. NPDC048182 TaxID=3365507 RepID=UPI003710F1E2
MDRSWWLALAAVVLLALVAAVVDGWGRGSRPGGRRRPPGRPAPTGRRPRAGEIWWAKVPYEDTDGAKDRPCLVLSARGRRALVAKITSTHRADRAGVIPLPPGTVGDARGRASYLETDELRRVPLTDFRRRAGVLDAGLWDQVRHLAR